MDTTCPRQDCELGTPLLKDQSSDTVHCAGHDTRTRDGDKGVSVYTLHTWLDTTCPRQYFEPGAPLLTDRSSGTVCCGGYDTGTRDGKAGVSIVKATTHSTATLLRRQEKMLDVLQ